ncbi:MAG: molybdenum cofactor guanylyltransferase, partial [candidate division Zixibacteria bacterium]|nr:molybdenum cofactor guanylyltransferase [candidate division Zixibacteria bacterium]
RTQSCDATCNVGVCIDEVKLMEKASAIILAGGKNTRIARNKAFIQLPTGETILQNTLNVLQKIFPEIILVTNQKEAYLKFNVQVVEDLIKESGPLGGIFTGLCYSVSKRNFVVACDMPFIKPALIKLLLGESGAYDVIIPEVDGEIEPLFALYSKNCIPVMFEHLRQQNLKMREVLGELQVKKIGAKEIDQLDPQHLSFFNINTQEDLRRAGSMKIRMGEAK